jgi:hypothetical protein
MSAAASTVGAKLFTLATSSTSLALRLANPKKFLGRDAPDEGDASLDSSNHFCVSVYDSCVVALDTNLGLAPGAVEWLVEGRESRKSGRLGRGGRGGGVPSREAADTPDIEALRDPLWITLMVGLAKSWWDVEGRLGE